ncbi:MULTISPECIES: DUF3604 domain-containing protein [unclassified Ruegeria]|uniref:DUF3604 domain-containing protein n=1 Tax=unclassified Ruegeria TaxID=2625375 RepID=UPI0014910ABF|nr:MULTISPECIES: DUF3604 domain-containing protein [unclassified Ruegeria]NOD78847.1 DUF3604 domain-containing protein [Ruegeria sp. HKCCD4332]UUV08498.1 DUF3604 domain-containing protein [Ruegeria sp. YS9]
MIWSRINRLTCFLLVTAIASGPVVAQDHTLHEDSVKEVLGTEEFSPYAGRNFPTLPMWGDTHLHTIVSVDAGTMTRLTQEDAFRFARGEEVITTHGLRAKLSRPLDFVVIADHAEMYGLMPQLLKGDREILATETGKRWYDALTSGDDQRAFDTAMEIVGTLSDDEPPIESGAAVKNAWREYTALADRYNEPGRFSAVIGYEYTTNGGNNLHRNVIFRGDANEANQTLPFSQYDSKNPEDLWRHLAAFEERTGGDVIAIPHNGNLSNGRMFDVESFDGGPLTDEIIRLRNRFERLYEVTQIKGTGEAHPMLSPDDAFADQDIWDRSNLDGTELKEPDMLQYEYTREALKNGMKLEAQFGVNPFKFGQIGSTDAHNGLTAVEENNFFGKHSGVEPEPHRWKHTVIEAPDPDLSILGWQQAAGGYAAVWAVENTREAIFDAMKRREVYGTTGSRMLVRFFGGYEFSGEDTLSRLPADIGYAKGVPMGGDLAQPREGQVPSFLVAALRDPLSGNLDRIQIIKGWIDSDGNGQEKIYDVVWSGDREPNEDGTVGDVGNTVDVTNATWTNTIGAPELIGIWTDPDFDPELRSFYYARVIEIPTPRWTAYEAKRFGVEMPPEVPMVTTERAYTAPIWYTPG